MPIQYAGILEEHRAVRERAGLFDLCHMGELFVDGPEAGDALAGAITTDPRTLAVGRARYTMICDSEGGILDDLIVYRLAEQEFLVVANASNAQVVLDALTERATGFDAAVRDDRDAYALVAVQGPRSAGILKGLTDADLDGLKYYAGLPGTVAGVSALIARTGYTGEDGFELFVAAGTTPAGLAGADRGGRPGGPRAGGLSAAGTRSGWRRGCRCTATS